ncbi:FtsX-like permease family protein [Micromonospora yangpuensis]|uniref:Putative ABC transport system permease protein n=1 Tax=Micromonospora yangpuensis TaxID=683228 RepID=A0A1C6UCF8_9ACTN|nr:FtsX-like permease family protein [Micromonospora yangpuensis]GGM29787.1 hypothetical protein GCM10012279_55680 [Micromonospora yangpuensis]SCL51644.1 putative ABC transport system permease protein [Micromonospora yangpuensis]
MIPAGDRQPGGSAAEDRQPGGSPVGGRRWSGTVGSWRAALRIARREAVRARGRTALVFAMITLPVLVLSFVAASVDMAELTPAEANGRRLGSADLELRWYTGGPLEQDEWGYDWQQTHEVDDPHRPPSTAQVTDLLPAGSRASQVGRWLNLTVEFDGRIDEFQARAVDLADPLARGPARLLAGRAPTGAAEIGASAAARRALGVDLGDRITGNGQTFTVVATVEFADDLGPLFALHPGAAPGELVEQERLWLVDLPVPPDADLVARLNQHGFLVSARQPLPGTRWPHQEPPTAISPTDVGDAVLVGGLGLLEVVLLVGPAFAVGVRRRRRDLALVAVAGGDPRHLRRIVLADGVVLGCAGALAGVVLGVAVAFAARPLTEQYLFQSRFGGYRCWPAALALTAAVAVLAGVLAALTPAWTAARQDVVAGLAGRRTAPPHRRRWLLIGVVLTVGGAGTAAAGAVTTRTTLILAGLVLGELGLVCCTPTLLGVLARAGRVLPLAPRIALRDASRNRSSAAPAISAVMAAVAGSVTLGSYLASSNARDLALLQPTGPPGQVLVHRPDPATGARPDGWLTRDQVLGPARTHLHTDTVAPLDQPDCGPAGGPVRFCSVEVVLPAGRACPYQAGDNLGAADQRRARADPRCLGPSWLHYGSPPATLLDDGTSVPVLTGGDPAEVAAARAVLRAGGAVVTDPRYLHDGHLTIRAYPPEQTGSTAGRPTGPTGAEQTGAGPTGPEPTGAGPTGAEPTGAGPTGAQPTRTVTVAGYAVVGGDTASRLLLSPAAARKLGVVAVRVGWVVVPENPPSATQQQRFRADLTRAGQTRVVLERPPPVDAGEPILLLLAAAAAVVTVGAAGVATGLAAAEGRADLSTLAAVGASPGVRRLLALCQAGVISGIGTALGILAGLVAAVIILVSTNRRYATTWPIEPDYPLVVPGKALGVLLVVPLVAMLGAALFTRSRLPVERRLD